MPPSGQKGLGKKGSSRRSNSRNTTPSLTGSSTTSLPQASSTESAYLNLPIANFLSFSIDEVVEQHGSTIPSSKDLEGLMERLQRLVEVVGARGDTCDKGMRMLSGLRKERLADLETDRRDDERKDRIKRDAEEEERGRKANKIKKKSKDASRPREERPLTHGAHGLAPQDGSNIDHSSPIRDPSRKLQRKLSRDNDSASSSLSPVAPATPTATGMHINDKAKTIKDDEDDEDDSSDEHQPPPAPALPHHQTFGPDPTNFPDPTVYEIRAIKPGMTEEQIKEIYSVANYPHDDLHDLIPGDPPDFDFSNAKPTNQVQANTFATYLEPYFRPFTEEDIAFLRERGDHVNAFVIPRRGKRHYLEVWAEDDGAMSIDTPKQDRDKLPANQPRGDIENMDDSIAETDQISTGPLLSRLLATMRPEHRAPISDPTANGMGNGDNGESNADLDAFFNDAPNPPSPLPPATLMKDSNSESWKKANHPKLEYAHMDERIKQELRHIGFLPLDTEPDYDAHYDDEIAARLRLLQARLKEQSILNGACKARLQDLTRERLAHQEYATILEDLDSQVQTAYLKRTRTMGKSKKAKRPGGGANNSGLNAGTARPGIGDNTKTLMERRKKWITAIGPVFDDEKVLGKVPKHTDPGSSVFKRNDLAPLIVKEKESWDEEVEEE
ncbi:Chromatin-remodeling complexes subunit NGG1 [Phlyctema vagabunda]|uniref:Chromatin-remodeling complexes subunit NGG1 n=1 Tax=Phlyctema vagabunda TaxID=108571 RepID=A0ABR4PKA8_9HELO